MAGISAGAGLAQRVDSGTACRWRRNLGLGVRLRARPAVRRIDNYLRRRCIPPRNPQLLRSSSSHLIPSNPTTYTTLIPQLDVIISLVSHRSFPSLDTDADNHHSSHNGSLRYHPRDLS